MMHTINIEASPGESIFCFAKRMLKVLHSSSDPKNTLVVGEFNGIEINANVYTHDRKIIENYHERRKQRSIERSI